MSTGTLFVCDLCAITSPEPMPYLSHWPDVNLAFVNVCGPCQSRPISCVLDLLRHKREASQ
jgi:hypothetical protein